MPRNHEHAREESTFQRVAGAVKRLFGRGRSEREAHTDESVSPSAPRQTRARAEAPKARAPRREADIPLDVVDRSYTPNMTSSKASFRSDGADHQSDQDFAFTAGDGRWNDEDHYTNKSGDPRIGTRRRTYEPAEDRPESRE